MPHKSLCLYTIAALFIGAAVSQADIYYVSTNSASDGPGTAWSNAFHTIQDAVNAATSGGDVVRVTNGWYATGGALTPSYALSNRVCITRAITVESVNGPSNTFIVGVGPDGDGAIRGVYMVAGSVLAGFTVTNGHTRTAGNVEYDRSGGGVFLKGAGMATNCVFAGGSAHYRGGGVYCRSGGTVDHCTISGNSLDGSGAGVFCWYGGTLNHSSIRANSAGGTGGGVYCYQGGEMNHCTIEENLSDKSTGGGVYCYRGGVLNHCTVSSNTANYGGGVHCDRGGELNHCLIVGNSAEQSNGGGVYCDQGGELNHCTITGNSAGWYAGGGVRCNNGGVLRNTVIFGNSASTSPNWLNEGTGGSYQYCCTTPDPGGTGNVVRDPRFADATAGDFHLKSQAGRWDPGAESWTNDAVSSLCIDAADPTAAYASEPPNNGGRANIGLYGNTEQASKTPALIRITDPTADTNVGGEVSAYDVAGTVNSLVVGHAAWTNTATGASGTWPVTGAVWQVNVGLAFGANPITVLGTNGTGQTAGDSVTITRATEHTGTSPIHYVWTNSPSEAWPYTNWTTAAHVIQDAVNAASAGNTVLVTNGWYDAGGAVTPDYALSNRVCITKAITVESVNGPSNTFIVGVGPKGDSAVRGVYMVEDSVLSGFTMTNGHTRTSGDPTYERRGGGVFLLYGGTVSNCVFSGNSAVYGGGACCWYGGTLNHCILSDNSADYYGGGTYGYYGGVLNDCLLAQNFAGSQGGGSYCRSGGVLNDCTIMTNSADHGGGVYCNYGGELNRCTIVGNSATPADSDGRAGGVYCSSGGVLSQCIFSGNSAADYGGGLYCSYGGELNHCSMSGNSADYGGGVYHHGGGALRNSIVYGNSAPVSGANWYENIPGGSFNYSCTTPMPGSGTSNITSAPLFVDAASGNVHLHEDSPCIDAGHNDYAPVGPDLDGRPRILDGDADGTNTVDMGCYEVLNRDSDSDGDTMTDGFEDEHGLDPADGSDAAGNPDNDPYTNAEEHTLDFDPHVSNDWFRITDITHASPVTVHFVSSSNRVYTFIGCSNLLDGAWTNASGIVVKQGVGGADSMTDTNIPPRGPYYRVRVGLP